jgi:HEAT repeat protein
MIHEFCPYCWREIQRGIQTCPYCGSDLREFEKLSYEQKLLRATDHPIRENRMLAIQLLGDLRSSPAVDVFKNLLETEQDIYVIGEIVRALRAIGDANAHSVLEQLRSHPSRLIRKMVESRIE